MVGKKRYLHVPLIVLIVLLIVPLFSYAVMLLWNSLVPEIFHGPVLSFWQALGLLLLAKIFFGGGGHHGTMHRGMHHMWHRKFEDRFRAMSPAERERFEHTFYEHCGKRNVAHGDEPDSHTAG
jgi:hypothetical protein